MALETYLEILSFPFNSYITNTFNSSAEMGIALLLLKSYQFCHQGCQNIFDLVRFPYKYIRNMEQQKKNR
jgi:hypothetical protein